LFKPTTQPCNHALNTWQAILCTIRADNDDITFQHTKSIANICIFEKGEIQCGIPNALLFFPDLFWLGEPGNI